MDLAFLFLSQDVSEMCPKVALFPSQYILRGMMCIFMEWNGNDEECDKDGFFCKGSR